MRSRPVDITIDKFGLFWRVIADFTPADPGQTSGPPERCYPSEPAEWDDVGIFPMDEGTLGQDLSEFLSNVKWGNDRKSVYDEILDEAEVQLARASDLEPPYEG